MKPSWNGELDGLLVKPEIKRFDPADFRKHPAPDRGMPLAGAVLYRNSR